VRGHLRGPSKKKKKKTLQKTDEKGSKKVLCQTSKQGEAAEGGRKEKRKTRVKSSGWGKESKQKKIIGLVSHRNPISIQWTERN